MSKIPFVMVCLLICTLYILLFTLSQVSQKIYGDVRSPAPATTQATTTTPSLTSSDWLMPAPNHTYGDGTCHKRTDTVRLREILQRWIETATRHNITYMLTYGSLLAAWRDGDVIPWDTDLDIYTMEWDNAKLDDIQDKRDFDARVNEFHLVLDAD